MLCKICHQNQTDNTSGICNECLEKERSKSNKVTLGEIAPYLEEWQIWWFIGYHDGFRAGAEKGFKSRLLELINRELKINNPSQKKCQKGNFQKRN
jgi:hypothetical protein